MTPLTKTKGNIPSQAVRWLRVNIGFIEDLKPGIPVFDAAAEDYRNNTGRDLEEDVKTWKESEKRK